MISSMRETGLRVGAVTDIALTAITTDIERDLREQLHDRALPAPEPAVNGYRW